MIHGGFVKTLKKLEGWTFMAKSRPDFVINQNNKMHDMVKKRYNRSKTNKTPEQVYEEN